MPETRTLSRHTDLEKKNWNQLNYFSQDEEKKKGKKKRRERERSREFGPTPQKKGVDRDQIGLSSCGMRDAGVPEPTATREGRARAHGKIR